MIDAYILIQSAGGQASSVAHECVQLPGVVSAENITGPYDLILRTSTETMDELGGLLLDKIQAISGVTRTVSCPVIKLSTPDTAD